MLEFSTFNSSYDGDNSGLEPNDDDDFSESEFMEEGIPSSPQQSTKLERPAPSCHICVHKIRDECTEENSDIPQMPKCFHMASCLCGKKYFATGWGQQRCKSASFLANDSTGLAKLMVCYEENVNQFCCSVNGKT